MAFIWRGAQQAAGLPSRIYQFHPTARCILQAHQFSVNKPARRRRYPQARPGRYAFAARFLMSARRAGHLRDIVAPRLLTVARRRKRLGALDCMSSRHRPHQPAILFAGFPQMICHVALLGLGMISQGGISLTHLLHACCTCGLAGRT